MNTKIWRFETYENFLSQEQITAAVAHAIDEQMQKLHEETHLDMTEFDNLLQPIVDTCTKDAISVSSPLSLLIGNTTDVRAKRFSFPFRNYLLNKKLNMTFNVTYYFVAAYKDRVIMKVYLADLLESGK